MPVYHRKVIVIVLLADKAARILAERTHLVLERLRVANQLGFIKHIVDVLHHLVAHLYTHANINRPRLMRDLMLSADTLQPVRAAPPGSNHRMRRKNLTLRFSVRDGYALASVTLHDNIFALAPEQDFNPVRQ